MFTKYALYTILFIVLFSVASWTFNYVNPWVGIGLALVLVIILTNKIINKFKN